MGVVYLALCLYSDDQCVGLGSYISEGTVKSHESLDLILKFDISRVGIS